MKPEALDYVIVQSFSNEDFLVWTPDENGGVIGSGKTRKEAIRSAIDCLGLTIADLKKIEIRETEEDNRP